jgi:metal-sulfur cluster biosynthetic enzyme
MNTSLFLNEAAIRGVLCEVYDPEFGVSVEDLGLINEIAIDGDRVAIALTLTSMYCPAGQVIMDGVHAAVSKLPGVAHVEVALVWEPVWTPERMSRKARQQLGWEQSEAHADE